MMQTEFDQLSRKRPLQIVTQSSAEFLALCARQDAGELVIEAVAVGQTPAEWVVDVRYNP